MSQRGGSVVTYVRYGDKVYSPIIDKGEADFILSFELLEAARWAEYLKQGGVLLTNTQKINPMPVITGAAEYPKALEEKLTALPIRLDAMDALGLALRAGSAKAVNLVLLGRLSAGISTLRTSSGRTRLRRASRQNSSNSTRKPLRCGAEAMTAIRRTHGTVLSEGNRMRQPGADPRHGRTSGSSDQVRHVWDNVPYYRAKMEAAHVTPDDIKGRDDLYKLPFLSKADLREAYPFGLLAEPLEDCVRIHSTSGTTGKRVVAFYTQDDIDLWDDCCARAHCGRRRHARRMYVRSPMATACSPAASASTAAARRSAA